MERPPQLVQTACGIILEYKMTIEEARKEIDGVINMVLKSPMSNQPIEACHLLYVRVTEAWKQLQDELDKLQP